MTFTGRGPDVNHVLYYTRKPKEVNVSLVEQVLGCKFTYTAQQEKEQFQEMLQDILGEELNYNTITAVMNGFRVLPKTQSHPQTCL